MKKGVLDRKHWQTVESSHAETFALYKVSKPRYTPLIDDTEACCHLFQLSESMGRKRWLLFRHPDSSL